MPSIRPFRGIIYNKEKVKDVAKVVAPPYDIIPPGMQGELYRKHKNNVVRLILGKIGSGDNDSDNRYTRAAKSFESWLKDKILVRDSDPAIYIYSQRYKYDSRPIERIGFISLMKLDLTSEIRRARLNVPYVSRNKVLPHENTLKAPKEDRLKLIRSVKANLSPIFMLYEDDKNKVCRLLKDLSVKTKPFIDVAVDGVRHRVWRLDEKKAIGKIEDTMAKKDIFIADGHHRYETSKNYAREAKAGALPQSTKDNSKFFMAYFVSLDEKALTILPTHRLIKDLSSLRKEEIVKKLEKHFTVEKCSSAKRLLARLKVWRSDHVFGAYLGKQEYYAIRLKDLTAARSFMGSGSSAWKNLDVSILHLFVLQHILKIRDEDDNIEFVKDAAEAFKSVDSGKYRIAFILNPTKVAQVKKIAEHGEKMPRKATYFYPKPLSGLVINKF